MFQVYPTHKVTELAREFEARLDALEQGKPLDDTHVDKPQTDGAKEVING